MSSAKTDSTKTDMLDEVINFTVRETGENRKITMRAAYERYAQPTRSGEKPPLRKVREFLAICKNRGLDPDAGDAWLLGYDTKDGPQFSIIVSYQSLARRAESNEQYDGIECGIVVDNGEGDLMDLEGVIVPLGCTLVGGWARVHRKDRRVPASSRIPLEGYDKGRSLWNSIKSTMICKCAKAAAMRDAFPQDCGDLYTAEEVGETLLDKAINATEKKAGKTRATERIRSLDTQDDEADVEHVAADGQLFPTHQNAAEV